MSKPRLSRFDFGVRDAPPVPSAPDPVFSEFMAGDVVIHRDRDDFGTVLGFGKSWDGSILVQVDWKGGDAELCFPHDIRLARPPRVAPPAIRPAAPPAAPDTFATGDAVRRHDPQGGRDVRGVVVRVRNGDPRSVLVKWAHLRPKLWLRPDQLRHFDAASETSPDLGGMALDARRAQALRNRAKAAHAAGTLDAILDAMKWAKENA